MLIEWLFDYIVIVLYGDSVVGFVLSILYISVNICLFNYSEQGAFGEAERQP